MPRFILSELDLPMGQFKVFTVGNNDIRVLCVYEPSKAPSLYYGWYQSVRVL